MAEKNKISRDVILDANRTVHSALADAGEYNRSPHFNQENQDKVKSILKAIVSKLHGSNRKMLDLGCGTGFMIHLALDLMDEIHGVDITDTMMSQVDQSSGRVHLQNSQAEHTPFENNEFTLVTAYSFLDHLEDYKSLFEEAYRVLEPGGIFYSDLNPSRHFTNLMASLEPEDQSQMPEIITREILGMLHNGDYWEEKFGISPEVIVNAEPLKSFEQGFDPDQVVEVARSIGFSEVSYEYDWYLGQAVVMHGQSVDESATVEGYLRMALPATRSLFKYLRFIFRK